MSTATPPRRLRRLERPALAGVLVREIINFSSYWRSTTFSSTVEPTIYLLAFGFGFGSLVSTVGGYRYVEFVGTGTVATAVLFSSAFPAMFGTLVKQQYQRTYDAILAAPVDTEELVTAEAVWIAVRAGTYGCVPMVVAMFFGLDPSWGMLAVPPIAMIAGFGWAGFGIAIASKMNSFENFSYVISAVLTPLFLVAGTFFPLDELPGVGARARMVQPALPPGGAGAARGLRVGRRDRPRAPRGPDRLRVDHVADRRRRHDPQARVVTEPSRRLRERIARDFPPGPAAEVERLLAALPDEAFGRQDPERVQAALVLAADAQWGRFESMLALLRLDWRDVLVSGGLGDIGWERVLERELASPPGPADSG